MDDEAKCGFEAAIESTATSKSRRKPLHSIHSCERTDEGKLCSHDHDEMFKSKVSVGDLLLDQKPL